MRQLQVAIVAAATFFLAGPVRAAPPGAESFDIRYYTSDEEGQRSRQMTVNDLQGYVNKARCECGQEVSARVRLNGSAGPVDTVQIRTYVGNQCDTGQLGNNIQARPCALIFDAFTNAYTRNVDVSFNPLWLATGVSRESPTQAIEDAIAAGSCESGQGNGGVWVCVENGMQTDCQPDEFIITGTQNLNTPEGEEAMGIRFDFDPPISTVSDFNVTGGDGAIVVSWANNSSGAIDGGFRILCALPDGSPVPGKGYTLPSVTEQNRGTIYFTQGNLCPDGPFGTIETNPDETTTGQTPLPTGGGSGGGTGGSGGGGSFLLLEDDFDPLRGGGQDCCVGGTDPGCENAGCAALVCQTMPSCCSDQWTDACATEAGTVCTTCGGAGDCCSANPTPGCLDDMCEALVCGSSPNCCKAEWDGACASAAQLMCSACVDDTTTGGSGTGDGSGMGTGTGTGTATATGTDTDTDTDTDGGLPAEGLLSLDWDYVCSSHLPAASANGRIDGLENGIEYQVIVVAYDRAGNPAVVSGDTPFTATPRETTDFWEQCEEQGAVCGTGGFCKCTTDDEDRGPGVAWLLALVALGLRRRRRA